MKILIVYASKSGTTKKCSELLAQRLQGVDIVNIQTEEVDMQSYDTIIIGGPIRYGKLDRHIRKFIDNHLELLLIKSTGLFICCGFEQQAEQHFSSNFPPQLLQHVFAKESFGGELHYESLSFFEKAIAKMAMRSANTSESPEISIEHIDHFAHEVLEHAL